jgi:predicted nuclease of predicted toxin-antitoxin system
LIRLATDEDFDRHIVRALRHRLPDVDLVRAQDAGLAGAPDPRVLEWATGEGRVLLSHDSSTMTATAYARIARGDPVAGVIIVPQWLSVASALEDLLSNVECSVGADWAGQVRYLPLR